MTGWIKIYRKFLKWEWYPDISCRVLALHYLLSANYEDKKWRNQPVKRGQLVTSLNNLSAEIGLSVQQIRTTHKKLSESGFCDIRSTNKYTVITICNYEYYQTGEGRAIQESHTQLTGKAPLSRQQPKKGKMQQEIIHPPIKSACIPFAEFWDTYDKKVGRTGCERAWKDLSDEEQACVMKYLPLYKKSQPEKRFRKNPEAFLKGKLWENKLTARSAGKETGATNEKEEPDGKGNKDYSSTLHF